MRTKQLSVRHVLRTSLVIAGLQVLIAAGAAAQSATHTVHLIAAPFTKLVTLPNGTAVAVPMWGFALDANQNGLLDGSEAPSVPGPRIDVPPGTSTLTIRLHNRLVDGASQPVPGAEPISVVVPGQAFDARPEFRTDGEGRARVFSMTPETAPGASRDYVFTSLKPGTFLYQSGTHQAVQVQMGLYGALTMNAAAGVAYPAIVAPGGSHPYAFDHEVLLLHSEIDVALHEAVAGGRFGRPELNGPTSTIDYKPSLFLINGASYANALTPAIEAGVAGERTLLRLLNAGLTSHVPVLENGSFAIVAEDGNLLPYVYAQSSILLSAGKTHDVLWGPGASGTYSLYDRTLSLSAAGFGDAGMLAKLRIGASPADPAAAIVAADDSYTTQEDQPLTVTPGGVLGNDAGATAAVLATGAQHGTVSLAPDGGFTYTPEANFFGVDSFTYVAGDGAASSAPATVRIAVSAAPDAPIANARVVGVDARQSVAVTLTGSDPDGDALTFYLTDLPDHGTVSIIDSALMGAERPLVAADLRAGPGTGTPIPAGNVIYTPDPGVAPAPPYSGSDGFLFVAVDATQDSAASPVDATVHPLEAEDECATCMPLNLSVMGRDPANPSSPLVPVAQYRWTLEEDRTYPVQVGLADPNTLSVSFHASYMPVRQSGDEAVLPMIDTAADPVTGLPRRYFVSVLPKAGPYTNGGAPVGAGQTDVMVIVNKGPQPTAQIRVRVFEDTAPLNGIWDTVEPALEGFEVGLDDAGGRYGMSGGQQIMDAFGNPLGTQYQPCSAPPCDSYEVASYGRGYLVTDANGYVLFKNLPPGKFTVKVRAPGGDRWVQTSTIEGTPGIDAWVKNNEPQYFSEFGPPGPHAEIGMARATTGGGVLGQGAGPFSAITGRVTNLHMSRPPDQTFHVGGPFDFTRPWVALNTGGTGAGALLFAQPTAEDGSFRIAGVPPGSYRLVVFDSALDVIIATRVVIVDGAPEVALREVPVFSWFTRLYHYVFEDADEDGFRDDGEAGVPEQAVNLRWRDGSMYQSSATDMSGFVPFEEVFPFFAWQVAEVDFLRFKATGVTIVVDAGGATSATANWPGLVGAEADADVLNPQPQSENAGQPFRTETGPVLVQGFQGFIGQTSVMLWGKLPYAPVGEVVEEVNAAPFEEFPDPGDTDVDGDLQFDVDRFHGGVSGIVHYGITRAENDPRWGAAEPWEPGIPRVRVQLWNEQRTTLLNEVETDSWDDAQPTGCQGGVFNFLGRPTDCFDGLRTFNQVRPAVFDGGYAIFTQKEPFVDASGHAVPLAARTLERPLPPGRYVVKVIVPNGYALVKEEDKNVDFGEEYVPQEFWLTGYELGDSGVADASPRPTVEEYPLAAPFCVGTLHDVPSTLSLFPGTVNAAFGGDKRPLCDAKLIDVKPGMNAAANFFLFTEAPVAGHIYGFVLDDTTNEFDPNAPTFGEKYAPPYMPVAIRDWTGREIARTYTDAYGVYNALVPSTWTAAAPIPSGMAPNMLTACINAPTMPGPDGTMVPDPHFYREYSHFCYTFQYMPGTTTYLDTPVMPTGAFTGNGAYPVDAEMPERTPVVAEVTNLYLPVGATGVTATRVGPYVVDRGLGGPTTANGQLRTILITSAGPVDVPNPAYSGVGSLAPKTISRDFGFGAASSNGIVRLGSQMLQVLSWSPTSIRAVVPTGAVGGQLAVERCIGGAKALTTTTCPQDSRKSLLGVTVTVATMAMHTARPPRIVPPGSNGQVIQTTIDAATPGDLVLVPPGLYETMLAMTKPVRLQGWGAFSTAINVVSTPAEALQAWRNYVGTLITANPTYLLPDQLNIIGPPPFAEGVITAGLGGEGAVIHVFGKNHAVVPVLGLCLGTVPAPANEAYCLFNENYGRLLPALRPNARIDGLSLSGSSQAAGIMVNGNNRYLQISNNRIFNNYGDYAGGIRIGHPGAPLPLADEDANNQGIAIQNNMVFQNAGIGAAGGGGIVIGSGAPGYTVRGNWVAGNFTVGQGAGIAHIGRSPFGTIERNSIVFNESFNQGLGVSGAGIFVGGRPAAPGGLTPGSGNVTITGNLIQGNQAGAGDGGGIALAGVNGEDIQQFTGILGSLLRYRVSLYNNVIANNVAALAGGGISLQDAAYVNIVHNTIVHNDSLATAGAAFTTVGQPNVSVPQPAGIVSRGHTPLLAAALGGSEADFSDPFLANNVVWQNRSFYFGVVEGGGGTIPGSGSPVQYGLIPNGTQPYWDLGVLGGGVGARLDPESSVLTDATGYAATNITTAPAFVASYFNGGRANIVAPDTATIIAPAAFDEGGNFIRPMFGPLAVQAGDGSYFGNYHVSLNGPAGANLNALYGSSLLVPQPLATDFDLQPRPALTPNRGADQKTTAAAPSTPLPQ